MIEAIKVKFKFFDNSSSEKVINYHKALRLLRVTKISSQLSG
ncbi:hypothetical protein [Clostridium yunnanense]|nr:hypothetical protein [Clostridium yunnanense]